RAEEAEELQQEALSLGRLARVDYDQIIETNRQLLAALAQIPALNAGDCAAVPASAVEQYELWVDLAVAAPDGSVRCRILPTGEASHVGDRTSFQRALQTRQFATGAVQLDREGDSPAIDLSRPLLDQRGEVQAVLVAQVDLDWLNELPDKIHLP